MKNIDNKDFNNLDNAFEKLRHINNPVSVSQIQNSLLLGNISAVSKYNRPAKIIAIASVSTVLMVSAIFWRSNQKHDKPIIESQATVPIESKQEVTAAPNPETKVLPVNAGPVSEKPKQGSPIVNIPDENEGQPFSIEGIKLTQLSPAVLSKLGITLSNGGVCINSASAKLCFSKAGTIINDRSKNDTVKTLFPNLITDDLGQYWRAYENNDKDAEINNIYGTDGPTEVRRKQNLYMAKNLNSMVAILVRANSNESIEPSRPNGWRRDVILWYKVSDEFLKQLPDSIAREMRVEYATAFPQGAIKPVQTDKEVPTKCDYFEVCRTSLKVADNICVSPNPFKSQLHISFDLKEQRNIRFNLLDISGRQIKKLSTFQQMEAGQQEFSFDIPDVQRGVYLITVESSKGEVAVQRIIKE